MGGLGCGSCSDNTFGCGGCSGMGDGEQERRFPTVEKVLIDYIVAMVKTGQDFYISPELNSSTVSRTDIMGVGVGLGEDKPQPTNWLSSIIAVATKVGTAVVAAAPAIAKLAGTSQQIQAAYQANQQLARQQAQIPNQIASQTVSAVQQDVLGTGMNSSTLLLVGGGLLALVLLTKK